MVPRLIAVNHSNNPEPTDRPLIVLFVRYRWLASQGCEPFLDAITVQSGNTYVVAKL